MSDLSVNPICQHDCEVFLDGLSAQEKPLVTRLPYGPFPAWDGNKETYFEHIGLVESSFLRRYIDEAFTQAMNSEGAGDKVARFNEGVSLILNALPANFSSTRGFDWEIEKPWKKAQKLERDLLFKIEEDAFSRKRIAFLLAAYFGNDCAQAFLTDKFFSN